MRMTHNLIAFAAAASLLAGCAGDDGTTTETKDAGGSVADASSSGGADSASSGGDTSTTGGEDGASSGGGTDATSSSGADATDGKKYQTCESAGDCVIASCAKTGFAADCEKACLGDSSPGAIQKAATLLTCAKEECVAKVCKDEEAKDIPGCVMDCMPTHCGAGLMLCLDDGKEGDKTCGDAMQCFENCGKPGEPPMKCMGTCINSLNKAGKAALKDVFTEMKKSGGFEECGAGCQLAMAKCINNGTWGTATCVESMTCIQKCDKGGTGEPTGSSSGSSSGGGGEGEKGDDGMCELGCVAKATEAGAKALADMASCFGDSEDETCPAKMLTCIDPQGPNTCAETFPCMQKCVADAMKAGEKGDIEGACSFQCLGKATKAGAMQFFAVAQTCDDGDKDGGETKPTDGGGSGGNDPEPPKMPEGATPTDLGPPPACIKSILACAGGAKGTDTCVEMLACIDTCEKAQPEGQDAGPACGMQCAGKSSQAAADSFIKLSECSHTCAKTCKEDKDPKACQGKCWTDTAGCMDAQKACSPPKS